MRRTIFMALLAALLLAPTAFAAGDRAKILRDCNDDSVLQGSYTVDEMRDARANIPTDMQEYSDCYDVLTRAISAKASSAGTKNSGGDSGGGGSSAGGSSSGSGGGSGGSGGSTRGSTAGGDSGAPPASSDELDSGRAFPSTPQEWDAVNEARKEGEHLASDLKQVSPGAARLSASVGRNGLPGLLVGVLALLAAAALALVAAPLIRRRGLGAH